MSKYKILDVAKFIIDLENLNKTPITNLRLQKILFILWLEYYKEFDLSLFDENFEAWIHGPVNIETYFEYCAYGGLEIDSEPLLDNSVIDDKDKDFIKTVVKKYENIPTLKLIKILTTKHSPWYTVFNKFSYTLGIERTIDHNEMVKFSKKFCTKIPILERIFNFLRQLL